MIYWIVSHTDLETMTVRSVSGTRFTTLSEIDYNDMYQMTEMITIVTAPFSLVNNRAHSRDILKDRVKGPSHFRMTPDQIYKTNILRKAYQYLAIFAC